MQNIILLAYLVAAVLFILGMKRLQSPATARAGNRLSALGMLIAVVATLLLQKILSPVEMIAGCAVGAATGLLLARRVAMTSMPELVAAFNGFGGLASALVAGGEIARYLAAETSGGTFTEVVQAGAVLTPLDVPAAIIAALCILIGALTFSGSFVAFGKLGGRLSGNPVSFPGMRTLTALIALGALGAGGYLIYGAGASFGAMDMQAILWGSLTLGFLALALGVLLVVPIGGADMPVVVALLNAYSGLAAAATGFMLDNTALIVSGALVGASGLILTSIMCEAMNRSLLNVLLGGFGGDGDGGAPAVEGARDDLTAQETSVEDVAIQLSYAEQVIIVPGYGMAVAQAQHQVRELSDMLQARGVTVKYAIHPVAGRMPGHMNVLLAEADVPYDQLYEMDDINHEFGMTDVSLVIGANDVVNPAARTDKASPIYGMPILDVDRSGTVVTLKRSLRPGYSGVGNMLFYQDNARMLFGDAKDSLSKLVAAVKNL